jgi:hypothetical protein
MTFYAGNSTESIFYNPSMATGDSNEPLPVVPAFGPGLESESEPNASERTTTTQPQNGSPLMSAPRAEDVQVRTPHAIPRSLQPNPSRFECLVQWEGVVTSATDKEFDAELREIGNPSMPTEAATFDLAEIGEDDLPLVKPGAIFYWAIGYRSKSGQKTKESRIRFRRLPNWTAWQLREAQKRAEELKEVFGRDEETQRPHAART